MGNGDFRAAIRRHGHRLQQFITPKEVFTSKEFHGYAKSIAGFLLRNHKLHELHLLYDEADHAPVAWTDGKDIYLNAGNNISRHYPTLEKQFAANIGILLHEVAHKLFLDFDFCNEAIMSIQRGTLVGEFDTLGSPELEANLDELREAVKKFPKAIARFYKELENIIADGHDEKAIKKVFPGFVASCINSAGLSQMEMMQDLKQMLEDGLSPLSVFFNLTLQYAKYGYCKVTDEDANTEAVLEQFSRMEAAIADAVEEDDCAVRWNHLNLLTLHLWLHLKETFREPGNDSSSNGNSSEGLQSGSAGSSSGGSGSSSGASKGGSTGSGGSQEESGNEGSSSSGSSGMSDKELEEAIGKALSTAQTNSGCAAAPEGTGKGISTKELEAALKSSSSGENAMSNGFDSVLSQMGQAIAEQEAQKALDQAMLDAMRNCKVPLVHKDVPIVTNNLYDGDKTEYESILRPIAPLVRNLADAINRVIQQKNDRVVEHHRLFGPIVEAQAAYRPDSTFFAKKKLPGNIPNMALSVLIDQSGSMRGEKIELVREAAIFLERVADTLGIPVMISGHRTRYRSFGNQKKEAVEMDIFSGFETVNDKNRYALASIKAGGSNRDGLAIRHVANMLAERQEEVKILVVISDGTPAADNYYGEEAAEDIIKTVAEFRRKGLIIYGAAIDDDREVIQKLYGSGFLSVTDLKSLSRMFIRLLEKHMGI